MSAPVAGQTNGEIRVKQITLTTTKTIGNGDKLNALIGVYQKSGVNTDKVPFVIEGEVYATAKATQSWAVGTKLYYQATGTKFTSASTGNTAAGYAAAAKAVAATSGWVSLTRQV